MEDVLERERPEQKSWEEAGVVHSGDAEAEPGQRQSNGEAGPAPRAV